MAGLKSIPVSALTFLLVAFTTGKFSVLGFDEEAEIRKYFQTICKNRPRFLIWVVSTRQVCSLHVFYEQVKSGVL